MTNQESSFFFGEYVLDMAVRELRHGDETVSLQPRVLDLLYFLIANRDRAVDKDAIQEAVWAGRIVSETALTRAIMKARRAIGDSADSQHLIRTVQGYGYQFIGEVQTENGSKVGSEDSVTASPADGALPPAESTGTSSSKGITVIVGLVALAALAVWWLRPAPGPASTTRIAVLPVHNTTSDEEFAWASLGLMGYTNDLLTAASELDTLTPADAVRYTEVSQWQATPQVLDVGDHLKELQRRYGATHVLLSELTDNVGGLRLSYALLNAEGLVTEGTMVGAQSTELIKGMVRGVTVALTGRRRVQDEDISITGDPFVDEAFARARSFSIEGRCAEALPLYDVVLSNAGDRMPVALERATCARVLGQWEDAEQSFGSILDALGPDGDDDLRADALTGLGVVLHRTGRLEEARERYDQGLVAATAAGDRKAEGRLLINRAILAKDRRDSDSARTDLARAGVAYRDAGYAAPGSLYVTQANIALNDGKLDEAERYMRQAIDSFRDVGDRRREALVINNMGLLRRQQGRFAEALQMHQQSLAIRRDIGDRVGEGRIQGMLSTLYRLGHQYDKALEAANEAVAIAREARDTTYIATGLVQRGEALRELERFDDAREAYTESIALFESMGYPSQKARGEVLLARLTMDEGNWPEAESAALAIEQQSLRDGLPEPRIAALKLRGDLALRRQQSDEAITLYTETLNTITETGQGKSLLRELHVVLANLYLDAQNIGAAEPHLGTALDGPPDLDVARLQARFAAATDKPLRAMQLLEAAKASSANAWRPEDEQTLASYREAANNARHD